MAKQNEAVAHAQLVGGGETALHSHAGGGNGPTVKAGTVTTSGGIATVTFTTAFPDVNYAILLTAVMGADANIACYSNKAAGGFDITAQNDKGVAVDCVVDWIATPYSNP